MVGGGALSPGGLRQITPNAQKRRVGVELILVCSTAICPYSVDQ
jgi:hypothetical protein